jgi:ATP-binding cassette, subfamily B, bacterial
MRFRPALRGLAAFRRVDFGAAKAAFRAFGPTLADQKASLALAAGLSLVAAGLEVFKPWPIKWVLDRLFGAGAGIEASGPFGLSREALVPVAAAAAALASFLLGRVNVATIVTTARVGRRASTRVRRIVLERLLRLGPEFHAANKTGDLLTRVTGDANLVRDLLLTSWVNLLGRGATFLGVAVAAFAVDPALAAVALAPFPLIGISVGVRSKKLATIVRKQREREGVAASSAAEALRNANVVAAYAAEDRVAAAFARDHRSSERAGAEAAKLAAGTAALAELLSGLGLAAILVVGADRAASGATTAGSLVLVLAYARSLYKPLRGLAKEGARLAKATASASRLVSILELPVEDPNAGAPAPPFLGEIAFENVSLQYADGRLALDDASFRVPAGSLCVFMGRNGAGKSTAIAVLLKLLKPTRGRALVDGRDVLEFSNASYRARLAYVPQESALFGSTIEENVLFGKPSADADEVRAALDAAAAEEFVGRLPAGIKTSVGEAGATLSGGEARRLAFARAAIRDARILVFDEPFEGLDPAARTTAARAIRALAAGRTTIVVSHVAVDLVAPDLVLEFDAGRVRPREISEGASGPGGAA